MTSFPEIIDDFRTFTNLPGMTYDAAKTDILFAEDLNKIVNSTITIEEAIGQDYINIWPIGSTINIVGGNDVNPPFNWGTWTCIATGDIFGGEITNTWKRTN